MANVVFVVAFVSFALSPAPLCIAVGGNDANVFSVAAGTVAAAAAADDDNVGALEVVVAAVVILLKALLLFAGNATAEETAPALETSGVVDAAVDRTVAFVVAGGTGDDDDGGVFVGTTGVGVTAPLCGWLLLLGLFVGACRSNAELLSVAIERDIEL